MGRFTASDARHHGHRDLDQCIRDAVAERYHGPGATSMRVYHDDPWLSRLEEELDERGFKNIRVPSITLKGDVYFEWDE